MKKLISKPHTDASLDVKERLRRLWGEFGWVGRENLPSQTFNTFASLEMDGQELRAISKASQEKRDPIRF